MSRQRAWLGALALGVPAVVAYVALPLTDLARYSMFVGVQSAAVAATVVGVRWYRRHRAGPWIGFGASAAIGLAAAGFYGVQTAGPWDWTYPTPADLLFLGMFLPLIPALLTVQRARTPGRNADALVDACIATLAIGVLVVVLGLPGGTLTSVEPLRLVQPMLNLLVLGIILRVAFDGGPRQPTMLLGAGAVVALVAADLVELIHRLQGEAPPRIVTVGLLIAGVLWTASALHPSLRTATDAIPATDRWSSASPARLVLLAFAALLLPLLQITRPFHGHVVPTALATWGSTIMIVMVVARIGLLMRDQRRHTAVETELERRRASVRLGRLVEHSSDVVVLVDVEGRVTYVTPSIEGVLGYAPDRVLGHPLVDLLDGDRQARSQFDRLAQLPSARPEKINDYTLAHADGTPRVLEIVATNLLDHPEVGGVVLNARDITEQRRLEDQLRSQALTDPLTGLANRTLFSDRVGHALTVRRRHPDRQLGVLFIDLDDFKTVNDSLGHAAGDELLVTVADRLRGCVRMEDTAARLGGDEFAVLLADADVMTATEELADRILASLGESVAVSGRSIRIAASIGIAVTTVDSRPSVDELLRQADTAMYTVKTAGKGARTHFALGMHEQAIRRLELSSDLDRALAEGEFTLVYQPLMDLEADRRIIGAEALVRWDHPAHGRIPPNEFIALAEETGAIVPLGRWVLRRACEQLAEWRRDGPDAGSLSMAVNVSAHQLRHTAFVAEVADTLHATGVPPQALTLELTESALIDDEEATIGKLAELRELGVRIAVDDFGTGYSSLSYLGRFPIDVLKMDKSFVDHLGTDAEASLTRGVLSMAALLRVVTVAEGIETSEQLATLRKLHCGYGQGYFFDRPLEPETFAERLQAATGARLPEDVLVG